MYKRRFLPVAIFFCCCGSFAAAQQVLQFASGTNASLRGLSAVNNDIVWASGSNGTVGRTTDGGKTWIWMTVKGHESRDFRDIEAFDAATAVIMAADEPAIILKTINGGRTWKITYENNSAGMFLNAMDFRNEQRGIVVGDPVNGRFFIAQTFNGGDSWREIPFDKLPAADKGEVCFAASGTNIRILDNNEAWFVSGGMRSRLFWKGGQSINLPLAQGKESTGANAIAITQNRNKTYIIIVGGDFNDPRSRTGNCIVSRDGGKTWIRPSNLPYGYRSCIEYASGAKWVTCGATGVDVSFDEGINWNNISAAGFHVCRKAKKGETVFLAGEEGRIGKLVW